LDRPPEIFAKLSGGSAAATCSANQRSTPARSIPSGVASIASCPIAAKALIVDFGGVLTTSIWSAFAAFCEREGLEHDTVRDLFRTRPEALALLRGLETGELGPAEFEPRFAELLGLATADGLIDRLFADLKPEDAMIGAVRGARRAGVRTGLISNSWGSTVYDPALMDELFEVVVISGEVGLHKPQPEIYLLGCERLGVAPADCVFVDDLRENIAGAEEVGMVGVLHRDAAQTVAELENLLGMRLGAPS
jgi:epoxide hydrolase-like predicted phosphatase